MKSTRIDVIAIWAVSAWPAFNFAASNWSEVRHGGAVGLLGVLTFTFLLALLGHAAFRFGPQRLRILVVPAWVALICLLFGYAATRGVSATVVASLGSSLPPSAGWLMVALVTFGCLVMVPAREKMRSAAVAFSFVVAGAAIVMLLVAIVSRPSDPATAGEGTRTADTQIATYGKGLPNVYYFILDAYAGRDELLRVTGYDNTGFISDSTRRGFQDVSGARSNYLKTSQTLGALFSLRYPQTDDPMTWQKSRVLYPDMFDDDQAPELIRRLTAQGYTFWHASSIWSGCPARHLKCLGDSAVVSPGYMTQTFLAPTPFGRPMMHLLGRQSDALGSVREHLQELAKGRQPIFVFAHHLAPHPPYFRGPNCERRNLERDDWNGWSVDERATYVGALRCVNRQVIALVDKILGVDPNALIVLQGDHGTAFGMDWGLAIERWPSRAVDERTSFLNLVRAPPECAHKLERPLGQLNTMRFVVACIERVAPDYLPEHSYLSTYAPGGAGRVVLLHTD